MAERGQLAENAGVKHARWAVVVLTGALVACRGGTGSPSTTPVAPPPGVIGQSPGASVTPPVLPVPVKNLQQGKRYWAVYAAVGRAGSTRMTDAVQRLRSFGVVTSPTDLSCDRGAATALGTRPGDQGVAVYFGSKSEADAFAGALDPPPLGVVSIRASCAD